MKCFKENLGIINGYESVRWPVMTWQTASSLLANCHVTIMFIHIFTTYRSIHRQTNSWTVQSKAGQLMD